MDQRITRAANRQLAKAKARSRNVGNLHVINTRGILPTITNPPSHVRTVTMTPKKIVENSESIEVKNIVHKIPAATKAFTTKKVASMSFRKKKINAAKNFLKQLNKESPVKKSNNSKLNLTDDSSKPNLSNNNASSSLINNSSPNTSSSIKASNSSNFSSAPNSSNPAKSDKYNPKNISHQSHSCLALYEVDMSLKSKKVDTKQSSANKEKKEKVAPKENPSSSWLPVDMKKINVQKDVSVSDSKISVKNKNYSSSINEANQCKPVLDENIPKDENNLLKVISPKPVGTKGERTVTRRYSGTSGHIPFRKDEYFQYENRYSLSKSSKIRSSRKYKSKHKPNYRENYHFSQKSYETGKSAHEELEALEDISDVPLDEDFEEVEAASWEDPNTTSEVPVGFRKYKIKYLGSKNIGFFKPKRFQISQDRTISCVNVVKEESVDVVSETEYKADHIAVKENSEILKSNQLNPNNNLETSPKSAQSKFSETLKQAMETNTSVCITGPTNNKLKEKSIPPDHSNNSASMDTKTIDTAYCFPSIKAKQEVISSSKFYYTCIPEEDSPCFYQGHSLIQKYLDNWESHLIGLEYIVEIRAMNKAEANNYHCGLCMEQLTGIKTDGQIVTNHVSGFKHASAYMAKHFPSCDYKFSKIGSSSNVLQRCCKEINHKLSYYFLCVTTDDYFQKHERKINELLNNLPHWSETDIDIDINAFLNNCESVVDKEVSEALKDIINKIAPGEEIATFISSRNENAQELRRKKARNSLDIKLLSGTPTVENAVTVGRNLIVLTPQHRSITKCSSGPTRPNLLQVITQEPTDSSADNSNQMVLKTTELSDQSLKDVSAKTVPSPVDTDLLNFKSVNKKAGSYRKYRAQQTTDKANLGLMGTENKEPSDMRTVRKITKNSGEITVCLESKNIDESADMEAYEEVEVESDLAAEVLDDLSNESGVQILEDSTVDSNFSDILGDNDSSPPDIDYDSTEVSKNKYKSRHRGHQKATAHSKHCLKRILGRNSRSAKDIVVKKETSDLDIIQIDSKSSDSIESELGRRIKDLSPDSKTSSNSRKITSPLRTRFSPVFSSDLSRMSVRRRSRSPPRRRSRSPVKRRRSPIRRYSRSPVRRRSRSPRRHSRSPIRRRSRSPKRRSRSPRRGSRSPVRRHSRSPVRRRSRSPFRKRSRSPVRRRSRSPVRRRSRSPIRRRSRSPVRRRSRSPVGRRSRSPRTSSRRKSRSPLYNRNLQKNVMSKHSGTLRKKFESEEISFKSDSRNLLYGDSSRKSGFHKEFATSSHSQYSHQPQHESERDLDPISDEEEPAYFNTLEGPRHLEEIKKLPEATRTMVMQLLQKFSASKVTPKDPSFSELMQFVNSHNSELLHPHTSVNQTGISTMPTSGLALQQFLLSNLAETSGHQNLPQSHVITQPAPAFNPPHSTGVPFSLSRPDLPTSSYSQSVFPTQNVQHHAPVQHSGPPQVPHSVPPQVSHSVPPQVQLPAFDSNPQVHQQFHPPQYDNFQSQNAPPSFQPKIRTDGMFKDLKATVDKLFGAIEGNSSEISQLPVSPEFIAEQNQSQWGQQPRNSFHQFDSLGSKNVITNDRDDSDFRNHPRRGVDSPNQGYLNKSVSGSSYDEERISQRLHVPPPDAKVAFCDAPRAPVQKNLFPVVSIPKPAEDVKISLAQRLAAVLVKVGMLDVPGALLQEMLMKIGAFSLCPPQDISEAKIIDILRRLGYINRY